MEDAATKLGLVEDTSFLDKLSNLVGDGREEDLLEFLDADKNQESLKTNAWDAVPRVCDHLLEDKHPIIITCCEHALEKLVKVGNSKEVLLVLLEQADSFKDDIKFKALLSPIQHCLLELPDKSRGRSIAIALETLHAHIHSLPLPTDYKLTDDETALLDSDPTVRRIIFVVGCMIDFLTPFVKQVSLKDAETAEKHDTCKMQVNELMEYAMKLFNFPLGHMDLSIPEPKVEKDAEDKEKRKPVKSPTRGLAEQLIGLMLELSGNFVKCLTDITNHNQRKMQKRKKKMDDCKKGDVEMGEKIEEDNEEDYDLDDLIPNFGLSVFAYVAFGEDLGLESLPQVYTHEYLLEFCSGFVLILLQEKDSLVFTKGLKLLSNLTVRINDGSLPADLLEFKLASELIDSIIKITVYYNDKDLRQKALQILPLMLKKFDMKGRNLFIHYVLKKGGHSGVVGYIVQLLKDEIDATLATENPSVYFVGSHLEKLMNVVCSLPSGETTDILQHHEHIMGALNLLRYLILKDIPNENKTGVWDYLPTIESKYLETLRTCINMSRAHYQLELKNVKHGVSKGGGGEAEMAINVGGESMPKRTKKEEEQMLSMAIHTFDMMESIMGRVSEVIVSQRRAAQKGGRVAEVLK